MSHLLRWRHAARPLRVQAAFLPCLALFTALLLGGCAADESTEAPAVPTAPTVPAPPGPYAIGGTLAGLAAGSQLVLQNNGQDALTLSADGSFTFATPVAHNGGYAVTIAQQPAGQVCSVAGGAGAGVTAAVTNIAVVCATTRFTVGGKVSGLAGGQSVVLHNNGADTLTLSANGTFSFPTPVPYNGSYLVTVSAQPADQTCTVNGHQGSAVIADIASVDVVCATNTYSVGGSVAGLSSQVTLANNGADFLTITANGAFTLPTAMPTGGTFNVTVNTQPLGQTCVVSNGTGTVAAANVTNVAVTCSSLPIGTLYMPAAFATRTDVYSVMSDGQLVFSGNAYGYSGDPIAMAHDDSLRTLYFSTTSGWTYKFDVAADGTWISTAGNWAYGGTPTSLLRDPLGRFLFVGSDVFNIRTATLDVLGNMTTPTTPIGTTFRPDTMVATPDGQYLIASSSATPGFDVFAIAPDGSLTSSSHLALAVAPSALAMHPSNSYLYVADPINNRIMEYRVDGAGNVTPLPAVLIATDGQPQHLSIDPSGRYLYATSPASGRISQYTIAADGTLVAMPQPTVAAGTLPGAPTIDPTGRFLYVPNASSLEIRQYVIGVTGALTPLTPATVSILAAPTLLYSVPW